MNGLLYLLYKYVSIQLLNGLVKWTILVLIRAHPDVYTGIVLSHHLQQPGLRD